MVDTGAEELWDYEKRKQIWSYDGSSGDEHEQNKSI
jgi:hypothetical protein